MEVIVIEDQAYRLLLAKLEAILNRLSLNEKKPSDKLLDNTEFIELLKISKRTAQNYRDNGMIAFSQIGNKIFYKSSDIEKFLSANLKPAFFQKSK